jgi:hypothetical protein
MSKIEMIEHSLRCFKFGLIGLLPIVGIPLAVLSTVEYLRVRRGRGEMWNPAQRYFFWGGVCSRMSLALYLVIPVVVTIIGVVLNTF